MSPFTAGVPGNTPENQIPFSLFQCTFLRVNSTFNVSFVFRLAAIMANLNVLALMLIFNSRCINYLYFFVRLDPKDIYELFD